MNYLERLKHVEFSEKRHPSKLTKLTEAPYVGSVSTEGGHFPEITGDGRWNPELAAQDYHWCYDCRYFNQTCTHPDNPFRKQCPQAPRKCQWYEDNHLEYT